MADKEDLLPGVEETTVVEDIPTTENTKIPIAFQPPSFNEGPVIPVESQPPSFNEGPVIPVMDSASSVKIEETNTAVNMWYKNPIVVVGIIVVGVVFIVVCIIWKISDKAGANKTTSTFRPRLRERFLATADSSHVDPWNPGAIKGRLTTDGMINRSWDQLVNELNTEHHISEGRHLGAGVGPSFERAFQNQQDIATYDRKAGEGVLDPNEMGLISNKIDSSANNANNNLYNRAITAPVKLVLAPNEIRAVIDEKYLGERNKNRQLATVSTIIHVPGFDFDSENASQEFDGFSCSKYSNNKKWSKLARDGRGEFRMPNKVGANTGDSVRINTDTGAEDTNPNPAADEVKIENNEVIVDGEKIAETTEVPTVVGETFRPRAIGTTAIRG